MSKYHVLVMCAALSASQAVAAVGDGATTGLQAPELVLGSSDDLALDAPPLVVADVPVAAAPDVPRPRLARALYGDDFVGSNILGGFSYRQRAPTSSRFENAETLSFSVLGILPNPKAPIVAGVDLEFGRYTDPSLGTEEELETSTVIVSMSTMVDKSVPIYVGAGAGVVSYELPSDSSQSGTGLALETRLGGIFPVGRFEMALEYHYFWGNAGGAIFDGNGFGIRIMTQF